MVPLWLQAALWGLLAGSALVVGAAAGYLAKVPARIIATLSCAAGAMLAMIADTMVPEAFAEERNLAGFVTVAGFLAAFVLTKLGG